jgi:hypothetical protein
LLLLWRKHKRRRRTRQKAGAIMKTAMVDHQCRLMRLSSPYPYRLLPKPRLTPVVEASEVGAAGVVDPKLRTTPTTLQIATVAAQDEVSQLGVGLEASTVTREVATSTPRRDVDGAADVIHSTHRLEASRQALRYAVSTLVRYHDIIGGIRPHGVF